ncbi:hypothetical protein JNB38_28020 [Escherichia coli]|nr:hypothetical protein [Escherichia coli]
MSIKNDGHYFCRAGGNRPDGLNEPVTYTEANGGKDNIINQAPKINFPISHLIEYYLLSKRPNDLLDYVTKIRIPGSKKYVKEIGKIFSEIKSS